MNRKTRYRRKTRRRSRSGANGRAFVLDRSGGGRRGPGLPRVRRIGGVGVTDRSANDVRGDFGREGRGAAGTQDGDRRNLSWKRDGCLVRRRGYDSTWVDCSFSSWLCLVPGRLPSPCYLLQFCRVCAVFDSSGSPISPIRVPCRRGHFRILLGSLPVAEPSCSQVPRVQFVLFSFFKWMHKMSKKKKLAPPETRLRPNGFCACELNSKRMDPNSSILVSCLLLFFLSLKRSCCFCCCRCRCCRCCCCCCRRRRRRRRRCCVSTARCDTT